jgi:signal transduction histidine kinase
VKPRLAIVFVIIVLAPLALVTWLGARFARSEQEMIEHRIERIALERLREFDGEIARMLGERERTLAAMLTEAGGDHAALRTASARLPIASQFFLINGEGELEYPDPTAELSQNEDEFLERTADLWLRGDIPAAAGSESPGDVGSTQGWYAWHWSDGLHLIFWRRYPIGAIAGVELNRPRFMADVIDALPDTAYESEGARYVLVDSAGRRIYQWGAAIAPEPDSVPLATLALKAPLTSWHLEYHPEPGYFSGVPGRGLLFNVVAALVLFVAVTVLLALYFYREQSREAREAQERVTFTNQVSHELKTPLTNIRMYAELLEEETGESNEQARKYLDVIQSESQRLSRLIGNVLTFGRSTRDALTIHPTRSIVDNAILAVCEHFGPALSRCGIRMQFEGNAPEEMWFDRDSLEQILGNLLSNAEKYARGATEVRINSRRDDGTVTITVTDDGPGVAPRDRDRIFEPFHRASDKLTDGVAGAGIGLTIARELARRHGGDVTLEPSDRGARFRVVLAEQPPRGEAQS